MNVRFKETGNRGVSSGFDQLQAGVIDFLFQTDKDSTLDANV